MEDASKQRMVENEVIFREANRDAEAFLEETNGSTNATVKFFCECSRPECKERIPLTLQAYKDLHQNQRQFIALSGHEFPEVEYIVRKGGGFNVVQKHDNPPKAEDVGLALKSINS